MLPADQCSRRQSCNLTGHPVRSRNVICRRKVGVDQTLDRCVPVAIPPRRPQCIGQCPASASTIAADVDCPSSAGTKRNRLWRRRVLPATHLQSSIPAPSSPQGLSLPRTAHRQCQASAASRAKCETSVRDSWSVRQSRWRRIQRSDTWVVKVAQRQHTAAILSV